MGDAVQVDKQELHSLLTDIIASDPNHTTHSMSIWNKARRMLAFIERGEQVSEARSWNHDSQTWVM